MNHTIVALATPFAPSAIGVLRLSGPEAFLVAKKALHFFSGALAEDCPRALAYGALMDGDRELDRVIVASFRAPHSYTGEDTVEISCHGNPFLLQQALCRLIACGARQAERGEFTKQAFLNGKLDLTEAEGVADLIAADSQRAADAALAQMKGQLSARLEEINTALLELISPLLAYVDYPDDEIVEIPPEELSLRLEDCLSRVRKLLASYSDGRKIRDGIATVIAGRPNAGKSSVMNRLIGYERSIVTDIPGTTRDTVEETITLSGLKLCLTDTAGLHQTDDHVEQLGVDRTRAALARAELILWVCDGAAATTPEEAAEFAALPSGAKKIVLLNKSDLGIFRQTKEFPGANAIVTVSAITGDGFDQLASLPARLLLDKPTENGELLCDLRHYQCLCRAEEALTRAVKNQRMTPDVLLADGEDALAAIGELTGKTVSEQIVTDIFSRFCVGK